MNFNFELNENLLQDVSRALTHIVFRNTIVEDLHAEGAVLNDETMKLINKEVNNRIYTLLKMFSSGSEEEKKRVMEMIAFSTIFGKNEWDPAELLDISEF